MTGGLRVLALADSDSYLKWAAHTLNRLPADVESHVRIVRSRLEPSPAQTTAATWGTAWHPRPPDRISVRQIRRLVTELDPDVVLVATTGPLARLVILLLRGLGRDRPGVVTGLPGMSFPAHAAALGYRVGCDAMIVHSPAEKLAFDALATRRKLPIRTVVARLPFLASPAAEPDQGPPSEQGRDRHSTGDLTATSGSSPVRRVVFAPQAAVPCSPADRMEILHGLEEIAAARPDLEVVVKLRGHLNEAQTHPEEHPYQRLRGQAGSNTDDVARLSFVTGALDEWLTPESILVTVSSTAALEAMSRGLPALILDDLGFHPSLLNVVYRSSGCTGPLRSLITTVPPPPTSRWRQQHYFHQLGGEPHAVMTGLAAARREGRLPSLGRLRSWTPAPLLLGRSVLRAFLGRV